MAPSSQVLEPPEKPGRFTLRGIRPDLRTVFMSGYAANVIADRGLMEEGLLFLQKPFALDALAAKVHEALDTPQA